jgi:hypothetical protein
MKISQNLPSLAFVLSAATLLLWSMPAQCGSSTYKIDEGKKEPLCRALVKRLNEYSGQNSPDTRCTPWDMLASYPEFTEPPWEELDPKEHSELLFQLMKGEYGPNPYMSELEQQKRDAEFRKRVDDFIAEGGNLRVWRSKLPLIHGVGVTSAKEQTFVQKAPDPVQTKLCVGTLHSSWDGGTRIALPDLSGLDPDFDPVKPGIVSANAFLAYTNGLFMYEGSPILVGGGGDVWQFSSGALHPVCNFKFIKRRNK